MRLPNFFIVGATKCGTTSLYNYLDEHPEIYMSPIKEPCYFASEIRVETFAEEFREEARASMEALHDYLAKPVLERRFTGLVTDWNDYLKLFEKADGEKAVGEASVCYLWSKTAAANIRAKVPDAKIVIILRDPAERAFSQYLDSLSGGRTLKSFREHILDDLCSPGEKFAILSPFLTLGLYYEQVKRFLDLFPRENIRIYWYDEYGGQIAAVMRDLLEFLGVDPNFRPDSSRKYRTPTVPRMYKLSYVLKQSGLWEPLRRLVPPPVRRATKSLLLRKRESMVLDPADRAVLIDFYREDIRSLAQLLGRDLSPWLKTRDSTRNPHFPSHCGS